MICEYPYVKGLTGYRRGCRCGRCKQQHRKQMLAYQDTKKANECFEGCMSSSSIERWAAEVLATMTPMERMLVAGLDV
jgi:hypothetical protein